MHILLSEIGYKGKVVINTTQDEKSIGVLWVVRYKRTAGASSFKTRTSDAGKCACSLVGRALQTHFRGILVANEDEAHFYGIYPFPHLYNKLYCNLRINYN